MSDTPHWLWHDKEITPDSYAAFRRTFTLETQVEAPELLISADSDFSLFVNGKLVVGSQFSDFPTEKTYSTFNLSDLLQIGKNVIAVIVHYIGENFCAMPRATRDCILPCATGKRFCSPAMKTSAPLPPPAIAPTGSRNSPRNWAFALGSTPALPGRSSG